MRNMALYRRYTNVAPYSRLAKSLFSSSTPAGSPDHVGRQVGKVKLSEPTSAGRIVSSDRDVEAITVNDHAPAFTLAPAPATSATGISSGWTTSRTRPESSPVVFALGTSSTSSTLYSEGTSSQWLTDITAIPLSTAHASTGSNVPPLLSSTASGSAPTQTSTASPVEIDSARTTGIIIGSVLGGLAVLVIAGLAIIYIVWRRRRRRRAGQADREKGPSQKQSDEPEDAARNTTPERERSAESPMTLPLQGATSPRTLRSEPIIVDTISPMTPITPHLSRWTSEKADIPSPAGHPAIDNIPPHLRHHPLFASTRYDDGDQGDDCVFPCSSSSPSPGPPGHTPPGPGPDLAAVAAAGAESENAAFAGFLFFDNNTPSSRSSTRRPSTRDSSAPRTALSMPPPHRPPPPRRHTRAGGQGRDGAARSSRRGSGSSVSDGCVVASSARPPSLPPPLPARNAARSKSLHDTERPAVWI